MGVARGVVVRGSADIVHPRRAGVSRNMEKPQVEPVVTVRETGRLPKRTGPCDSI